MVNIFIIHGVQGEPNENWFPWLKSKLETLGHNIIVPQFPTPKDQTLDHWSKVLKQHTQYLTYPSGRAF